MATVERAQAVVDGLKQAGVDLVISVPDINLRYVLQALHDDDDIQHVPVNREEEGVGIAAGAMMTGRSCAMVMQNAGFLNSCNALNTTALQFGIPLLMLIYYAGDLGDQSFHSLGVVTEPVLKAMTFKYWTMRDPSTVADTIVRGRISADVSKRPVALLLTRDVL